MKEFEELGFEEFGVGKGTDSFGEDESVRDAMEIERREILSEIDEHNRSKLTEKSEIAKQEDDQNRRTRKA